MPRFLFTLTFAIFTSTAALSQERPIDLVLAVETTVGTEQSIGLLNRRALEKGDRAGVLGISGSNVKILQSLTDDREALASALQHAGARIGVAMSGIPIRSSWTSDLSSVIARACEELERNGVNERRAILLLFASEDPTMASRLATLQSNLAAANARLYAVQIYRRSEDQPNRRGSVIPTFPSITASTERSIAELTEHSGGRLFRGAWDLRDIVKDIRKR